MQPAEQPNNQQVPPLVFLHISCPWPFSVAPVRQLAMKLPQIILSGLFFLTSHPSVHCAGQTPPSLSHIFHWKTKWYSMLPIASPFISVCFFHPCLFSVLQKELKAVVELHGYLGTGDRQVEILAWLAPWLDRLQTFTLAILSRPETQVHRQRGETTRNEIQERRRSENHFPFDEEIWLPWHAEIISYLAVKDAPRSPRSLEPGLCLLLTPWTLDTNMRKIAGL